MNISSKDTQHLSTSINDTRIIKNGHFLRKHRIDEIPQLLNVLGGSLSLVGPRPEKVELANYYASKVKDYNRRHNVMPGITGYSQITLGYISDLKGTRKKTNLDLWYVDNKSHKLDIFIIMKTVKVVLTGQGAR